VYEEMIHFFGIGTSKSRKVLSINDEAALPNHSSEFDGGVSEEEFSSIFASSIKGYQRIFPTAVSERDEMRDEQTRPWTLVGLRGIVMSLCDGR
jgi:hypothetical protein